MGYVLPPNKPQKTVDTPRNFFLFGASMHGKSTLAGEFPNPFFIDTDGNAKANPFPSEAVRNVRGKDGKIERSVIDQLDDIITALQTQKHTFETLVIDVVDDIVVMIEAAICDREGVETLADIGYGKGYAAFKSIFQQLVIELKALPMNIVYVSRISTKTENNVTIEEPSLPEKHVNIVNGNCDYMIQCKKIGKNHIRQVRAKRKNYVREQIDDANILAILDTVTGAFERSRQTSKKEQDAIVKKLEEAQEEVIKGADVFEEMEEEVAQQVAEALTKEPEPTPAAQPTQGLKSSRPRPKLK